MLDVNGFMIKLTILLCFPDRPICAIQKSLFFLKIFCGEKGLRSTRSHVLSSKRSPHGRMRKLATSNLHRPKQYFRSLLPKRRKLFYIAKFLRKKSQSQKIDRREKRILQKTILVSNQRRRGPE